MAGPETNLELARTYIASLSAGAGPHELDRFFSADFVHEEFPNRLLPNARFAIFLDFRDGRIVRQRNYDCFDPW